MRSQPNIIVTGTPGVGKTSHCELLAQNTGLKHVSINDIVIDRECYERYDHEFKSWIVDDDKLLDSIEDTIKAGGCIIDWHGCELFPKSWIDLVIVLRVNSTILYDRLKARNYPEAKLQENLDVEIMEVLVQEARDSYDEEIVIELMSNKTDDLESNIERIESWIAQWAKNNSNSTEDVNSQ